MEGIRVGADLGVAGRATLYAGFASDNDCSGAQEGIGILMARLGVRMRSRLRIAKADRD